jgi:hypothetical protein
MPDRIETSPVFASRFLPFASLATPLGEGEGRRIFFIPELKKKLRTFFYRLK